MWQHWEASKQLFITLCVAFFLSCSMSGVVLFRLFGKYRFSYYYNIIAGVWIVTVTSESEILRSCRKTVTWTSGNYKEVSRSQTSHEYELVFDSLPDMKADCLPSAIYFSLFSWMVKWWLAVKNLSKCGVYAGLCIL